MFGSPGRLTDLHSHLVPGVDDGARNLDEALDAVRKLMEAGAGRMVTTPHLDGSLTHDQGLLRARLKEVDVAWSSLKEGVEAEFVDVEIHRGHEVMLDIPDPDLSDPRLHLAETQFVLVEWPGLRVPPATGSVLDRLVDSGIRPILAHPERYRGLDKELKLPGLWRKRGAILQVNYGSLLGRYGDLPRKRAIRLLERGWADLLASDFHGRAHLSPFLIEAGKAMSEWGGEDHFRILASVNPARILEGDEPLPVPPLVVNSGAWQRILQAFKTRDRW